MKKKYIGINYFEFRLVLHSTGYGTKNTKPYGKTAKVISNDNDTEKWRKNSRKVNNDTKAYYAEELALLDVLNGLWNEQSEQAATDYFGCYGKAANACFSASGGRK